MFKIIFFIYFLINLINALNIDYDQTDDINTLINHQSRKCEPLSKEILDICNGIAYNQTRYPNFLKQKTQLEAVQELYTYQPLIRVNCSPQLKLFLCSLYAPPCIQNYTQGVLKPCKELCDQARGGCELLMKTFKYEWPEYLKCDKFPLFNSAEACITDQSSQQSITYEHNSNIYTPALNSVQMTQSLYQRPKLQCPTELHIIDSHKNYYLYINDDYISDCGMPCDNTFYDKNEILFARLWVLIWSSVCFASTLFTVLTYLIEMSRFKYPERPIVFLSACYMMISLAYLIGSSSLTSNTIVCQAQKNPTQNSNELKEFLLQGTEYYPCTVLFMIIYFFTMSSSIWWVILTLTWFLAAGLKWGHEAIESVSSYFHLAAWAIPAIKMIAILALKKVDADILSGVCYTGITNMSILRGFILAPSFFYLILGSLFLLAGFVSLFRIRTVMKHEGTKTDKLEKFMVRIGVFSILYMLPAIILICCYFYEQSSYNKWIDNWLRKNFSQFKISDYYLSYLPTPEPFDVQNSSNGLSIQFALSMIKYSMLLIVGITSGFWIWSKKTMASWRRFLGNVFFCCCSNIKNGGYKHEAAV